MAKANLPTSVHTHYTLHLNLLNENTGLPLNFFLFRYLLCSTLFKQNFRYLVLVKNVNFFHLATSRSNYLSFKKVMTDKKHVFKRQDARNKLSSTFKYGMRVNSVSNLPFVKGVTRLRRSVLNVPKPGILHKQKLFVNIYNFHPFFNKFGSNLRSNK